MSNFDQGDPRDAIDQQTKPMVPSLVDTSTMPLILRAEIDSQIATARQYPRNMKKAMENILGLATMDDETAAECCYALVRKKKNKNRNNAAAAPDEENKPIEGPSIRLAEIASQCWGNNRTVARVVSVNRTEKYVEAIGIFHDLETNQALEATVRRNIQTSGGYLFSADMITVTGNAACSIARRNAILGGIPRGIYRPAYHAAREIIAGSIATLPANREKAIKAFASFGVTVEQILEALDIDSESGIKVDHIAILRAMFAAIKNGEATVEEMFAKPEKASGDPDFNPLIKKSDSISTGGANEIGKTADGQTRPADASATENRTGTAQNGGQAGETPATGSKTEAQRDAQDKTPAPASGEQSQASDQGAANADPGTSQADASRSSQPDLLSAQPPAGSKGEPSSPGQTDGADGSRGETPSAPDRLRAYSAALLRVENGAPKLGKQSDVWMGANGLFAGDDEKKRALIYAAHLNRIAGSIDIEACKKQVEGIIGK
jgi:hypothetical protein